MDHDQLLDALQRAVKRRKDAEAAEHEALLAALRSDAPLADIVTAGDSSRETLRRIARKEGIPLRREPTVISKKKAEDPD